MSIFTQPSLGGHDIHLPIRLDGQFLIPAKFIYYDNSVSGIISKDVQGAITELKAAIAGAGTGTVTSISNATSGAGIYGLVKSSPITTTGSIVALAAGTGMAAAFDAGNDKLTFSTTAVTSLANNAAATGYSLLGAVAANTAYFATLVSGGGISISLNGNADLVLTNDGIITVTDATSGAGYYSLLDETVADVTVKPLTAGPNITITDNGTSLEIEAAASSSNWVSIDTTCASSSIATLIPLTKAASTLYSVHYFLTVMFSEAGTGSLNPWQYYHGNYNRFCRSDATTLSAGFPASSGGNSLPYGSTASFDISDTTSFRFRITNNTAQACKIKGDVLLIQQAYP